ncbi:MAG: RES family NAD+ phosphorylase [Acidobacteria bacterium]|nr:RES family NAD+ phosphorylase [Acidobacteriota bacterium]
MLTRPQAGRARTARRQVDVLASIPAVSLSTEVFRFAICRDDDEFLQRLGLDDAGVAELKELLDTAGGGDWLDELLDAPFRARPRICRHGFDVTRFSDGSFPIFYCSQDAATAEAEARHWFVKFAGRPRGKRLAYYRRFRCTFAGDVKDLVPMGGEWPGLTDRTDYRFCNDLGKEARKANLHGLLAPSVRRAEGVNLPVFRRSAVSAPEILEVVRFDVSAPPEPS